MRWTKPLKEAMTEIVTETRADRDAWIDPKHGQKIVDEGLAVYMSDEADAHGNRAMRSTQPGYDWFDANVDTDGETGDNPEGDNNDAAPETPDAPAPEPNPEEGNAMSENTEFTIETGLPAPVRTRSNTKASMYPFDDLPAPTKGENGNDTFAGFFVPESVKKLSSVVSAANRRYSKVVSETEVDDGKGGTRKEYEREYERKFSASTEKRGDVTGTMIRRVI
jgi:hypothetical protein